MKKILLVLLAVLILIVISVVAIIKSGIITTYREHKIAAIYLQKANEASLNGDYRKAIQNYRFILNKDPNNQKALIGLARTQLLALDFIGGVQNLLTYKKKFGEDKLFLTEEASFFSLNDRPRLALKIIKKLLVDDPHNRYLLELKGFALGKLSPEINININPLSEFTIKLLEVDLLEKSGKQLAAIATYYQMLNQYKDNQEVLNRLLMAQIDNADYRISLNFNLYEKIFGRDDLYFEKKARWLASINKNKEALPIINQLLVKYPNSPDLLTLKSTAEKTK